MSRELICGSEWSWHTLRHLAALEAALELAIMIGMRKDVEACYSLAGSFPKSSRRLPISN